MNVSVMSPLASVSTVMKCSAYPAFVYCCIGAAQYYVEITTGNVGTVKGNKTVCNTLLSIYIYIYNTLEYQQEKMKRTA